MSRQQPVSTWVREVLVCPRDHLPLEDGTEHLDCPAGHSYPVVDEIPIFLLEEATPTQGRSYRQAIADALISRDHEPMPGSSTSGIDPYVQSGVSATCGRLYQGLIGRLREYPIPRLPLPESRGARLLEVGCNWGRWCVGAARAGYRPVGIDHRIPAIRAARRVARQLGVKADYIVADGRRLPFAPASFEVVFSYSVLQHMKKEYARQCLAEVGRTIRPGGLALVQMPNAFGVWNLGKRAVRTLRAPRKFDVRYWTPGEMREAVASAVGPATLSIDGYFSLNAQASDVALLPFGPRLVVRLSEWLRRASGRHPWLRSLADSLYVTARREPPVPQPADERIARLD